MVKGLGPPRTAMNETETETGAVLVLLPTDSLSGRAAARRRCVEAAANARVGPSVGLRLPVHPLAAVPRPLRIRRHDLPSLGGGSPTGRGRVASRVWLCRRPEEAE